MKQSLIILLCLYTTVFSQVQQNPYWEDLNIQQADSLRLILEQTKNDTNRMYIYRELGFYYDEVQRDSSLYFYNQQLLLAQKLKLSLWEAEAYCGMGLALTNLGNTPKSLQVLLKGKTIADNNETENNVWHVDLLSRDKNPNTARMTVLGRIYSNMGVLYIDMDDMKKLLANFFESRKIAEKINDKALLSIDDMNLGEAYTYLDKLDSALVFEQEALQSVNKSGYKKYKGFILQLIGNIYLKEENYDSAKKYYYESVQTNKQQQDLYFLANAYVLLADLFEKTGQTDSSLYYSKKGLAIFQTIGSPEGKLKGYKSLSSIYKLRNNIDSAFVYQGLAMSAYDSLNNEEKIKMFQEIGFDQELKMQQMEKERIETQDKIRTYAMLAGIVVVMIIAFLLYRNNRNRRKANELLQKQNKIIKAENERRAEELEEARRLQLAMLPKELPKLNNLELAVYMKTATEVGGDYYDFSNHNDGSFNIAIGDATGHGMKAGTLVTMMKSLFTANSSSKDIEDFFASSNAAIKNSNLKRMMVAFAMLNITDHKAKFINAAMPPLYHYKKQKAKTVEIKHHKLPLGAMSIEKYNPLEINLSRGDILIMMSDGFPELHNPSDELLGYEKVYSFIEKAVDKEPKEIIEYLKDEGAKWSNNKELQDDVTFVVIKVK